MRTGGRSALAVAVGTFSMGPPAKARILGATKWMPIRWAISIH
jgi:hypothetical protein